MDARPAWHGAVTPADGSAAMPMPAAGALSRGAPARKPPLAAAGDAGRFAGDAAAGSSSAPRFVGAGGVEGGAGGRAATASRSEAEAWPASLLVEASSSSLLATSRAFTAAQAESSRQSSASAAGSMPPRCARTTSARPSCTSRARSAVVPGSQQTPRPRRDSPGIGGGVVPAGAARACRSASSASARCFWPDLRVVARRPPDLVAQLARRRLDGVRRRAGLRELEARRPLRRARRLARGAGVQHAGPERPRRVEERGHVSPASLSECYILAATRCSQRQ